MTKDKYVIIGSLCALALVVAFLVMPSIDNVSVDKLDIEQKKAVLLQVQAFNKRIDDLTNQFNDDEIEKMLSVLPKEEEEPALLISLETLATSNGLIMNSVNFNKIAQPSSAVEPQASVAEEILPKAGNPEAYSGIVSSALQSSEYKVLEVSLNLIGTYSTFKNYLQAVEKNQRLMDITSLNFNSSNTTGQGSSIEVHLYVYYQ